MKDIHTYIYVRPFPAEKYMCLLTEQRGSNIMEIRGTRDEEADMGVTHVGWRDGRICMRHAFAVRPDNPTPVKMGRRMLTTKTISGAMGTNLTRFRMGVSGGVFLLACGLYSAVLL